MTPRQAAALAEPGLSAEGRRHEREDVLAWLDQRIANCATMAAKWPEQAELARDRQRQLEVIRHDIAAGLHERAALVAAELAKGDA